MELAILDMMKSQQESIQRSEENDKRVFEALLKSQTEPQRQHQEFVVTVLGKLGDIFASKKIGFNSVLLFQRKKRNSLLDCCKKKF